MALSANAVNAIGLIAGTCTTLSFLPQLVTVVRRRSAEDISYSWLTMFAFGVLMWLIYGLFLHSLPVIAANLVTLLLVLAIIVLKAHYQRLAVARGRQSTESPVVK